MSTTWSCSCHSVAAQSASASYFVAHLEEHRCHIRAKMQLNTPTSFDQRCLSNVPSRAIYVVYAKGPYFEFVFLLQERDGMRAILESYDSELGSTEYSPQLSKRLKEAEDVLHRTQSHNVEMEVRDPHSNANHLVRFSLQ